MSFRALFLFVPLLASALQAQSAGWALAVHGGAGEGEWEHMDTATASAYRASLRRALAAGVDKLQHGAPSLDAVETAIKVLEDDPLFNAGRGAGFTSEGKNEMDASIMEGATLKAGAVAGVQSTKNPISLARAVMERSPYVMLAGPGTDAFARQVGLPQEPPSYFFTDMRWKEFQDIMKASHRPVPHHGTVGVVARDKQGNISAGTSTGGMQGKLPGRVGDSPIIGAGTYAANRSCAVSATGVGEYFIRLSAAREICSLIEYRGMSLQAAADFVIQKEVGALKGGEGGVIVLDTRHSPIWSFNTLGMFRARQTAETEAEIKVEPDDHRSKAQ